MGIYPDIYDSDGAVEWDTATRSAFVPRFIRLYQRCGHLSCARCCLQCVGATPLVLIPTMDGRLSGET